MSDSDDKPKVFAVGLDPFYRELVEAIRKQQPFKPTVKSVMETLIEDKATAMKIDIRKLAEEYHDDDEAVS